MSTRSRGSRQSRPASKAAPNPRPVQVDDQGKILEADGTPIVFPGLEPEKVKAAVASLATNPGRSLREIKAERGR